jgi:FkbM family methyltransferase
LDKLADKLSKGVRFFFFLLARPGRAWRYLRLFFNHRSLMSERLKYEPYRQWFQGLRVKTFVDAGSHVGPFAFSMRDLYPDTPIYSFEPLPDCFKRLQQNLAPYGHFKAFNVALGDRQGDTTFYQSSFSESSSLLEMSSLHKEAFPFTADNKPVAVKLARLDDFLPEMQLQRPVFLKLDVQGYELQVLKGAQELLKSVDFLMAEVSFKELYKGQARFDDIYQFLKEAGFEYAGSLDPLLSPLDGTILQTDAVFTRK